jgi:hypothetical protein
VKSVFRPRWSYFLRNSARILGVSLRFFVTGAVEVLPGKQA